MRLLHAVFVVVSMCLSVQHVTGRSFNFMDFCSWPYLSDATNGLGSVQKVDNSLHLVSSTVTGASNALWFETQVNVAQGFQTKFSFVVRDPTGFGAEGFAFVLQNQGREPFGGAGPNLGYSGLLNSIAVEFDMHKDASMHDPNGNHISFHTRGDVGNSALEQAPARVGPQACTGGSQPQWWLTSSNISPLADGNVHTVQIAYVQAEKVLQVTLDNALSPQLQCTVNLAYTLDLYEGNTSWVGFTASSGEGTATIELQDWYLQDASDTGGSTTTCFPGFTSPSCQPPPSFGLGSSCANGDNDCGACTATRECCAWCGASLSCVPAGTHGRTPNGGDACTSVNDFSCKPSPASPSLTAGEVAGIVATLVVVVGIAVGGYVWVRRRRHGFVFLLAAGAPEARPILARGEGRNHSDDGEPTLVPATPSSPAYHDL